MDLVPLKENNKSEQEKDKDTDVNLITSLLYLIIRNIASSNKKCFPLLLFGITLSKCILFIHLFLYIQVYFNLFREWGDDCSCAKIIIIIETKNKQDKVIQILTT